jgi:hypothetical protein
MNAQAQSNNHRWSPRRPRQHDVVIYGNGTPFPARLRDISIGGMCVETDLSRLEPNASVQVLFRFDNEPEAPLHRFPANVIWTGQYGAGLMFNDYRPETLRTLRHLIGETPEE